MNKIDITDVRPDGKDLPELRWFDLLGRSGRRPDSKLTIERMGHILQSSEERARPPQSIPYES